MPVQGITSKIASVIGNKESLIPIMIKDGVDSASLTYHAYKAGGKAEGQDRAVDEFGTQAVWIGGIPFYKKLIDASVYKKSGLNPGVDIRVISNPEYAQWAQKNAKGMMKNDGFLSKLKFLQPQKESVQNALSDALKDGGDKIKKLYRFKVLAAAALTLGSFFALTKYKHSITKKTVLAEVKTENKNQVPFTGKNIPPVKTDKIFEDIAQFKTAEKKSAAASGNAPSFKGLKQVWDGILFNPVHTMKIIDAGITAERIGCSRNKTEFAEHTIKEGGFLFFLYCFGNMLENGINKLSSKKLGIPIDAEIDVITDKDLKESLKKKTIAAEVSMLPKDGSLTDKLNFIIKNPDNILVKAAKKSKTVLETKDAAGNIFVDTSKYIDMKKIETLALNLKTMQEKFIKSGLSADEFVSKMTKMKTAASAANILASCLFLGYLIPKAVYKYREYKTGTREFHAALDIKKNAA